MKVPEDSNHGPLCYTTRQVNNKSGPNTGTGERLAYTAHEASRMIGVDRKTIYRLCARKILFRSPALRTLLIPRWSLEEFLRSAGK
jgi:hypothetical protein